MVYFDSSAFNEYCLVKGRGVAGMMKEYNNRLDQFVYRVPE